MKRRIVITLLLLATQAPAASPNDSATAIDPSDKNILYTGRWFRADPAAPWCSWQGCSIIANFKGTSISARLQALGDEKDWIFFIIRRRPGGRPHHRPYGRDRGLSAGVRFARCDS